MYLLPVLINLQIRRISNNPQGLFRSRQCHIQSTLIGQKSQTLNILRPSQARSHTGKNDDIRLATLEGVHGADLDKLVFFLQFMLVEHMIHCCSDCLNLSNVRSNHTDGVICFGGQERDQEWCDDGTDGGGFGLIGIWIALTFAFSLAVKTEYKSDWFIHKSFRIE